MLSYAGHLGAGGARPHTGLLVVLGLLLAGFLVDLADRRRGPLAILALVGGSQLAMHMLLQMLSTGAHQHTPATHPVLMLGAHTLATMVTAGILAGAESAVFAVASALASRVPLPPTGMTAIEPPRRVALPDAPEDERASSMLGHRFPPRRGPPPVAVLT